MEADRRRVGRIFLLAIFALNACGPEDEGSGSEIESGLSDTLQNPVLSIGVPLTNTNAVDELQEIRRIEELSPELAEKEEQVDMLNAMVLDGDREAVLPLLLEALHNDDVDVRLTAVLGLQEFARKPEVVGALLEVLDDPDNLVVIEAIETLDEAGDIQAIDKLTALGRNHDDEMVRELATELAERLSHFGRQLD